MMENLSYFTHDSDGLKLFDGGPNNFDSVSNSFSPQCEKVKHISVAKNGKKMAWIANGEVNVVDCTSWEKLGTLKHPKAQEVCFSPRGTYIAVFDSFVRKIGEQAVPNLSIYSVVERKLIYAVLHQAQFQWQPQWTEDESIVARQQTSEVMFYKSHDLESYEIKKVLAKVRSFSLSQSCDTHYVAFFVPCLKDSPAYVHLYKYPEIIESSAALANKSFYKVETVEYFWNSQSSAILLLTSAPPDKTGTSYYGEQMLFYLSIRGDSNRVTFDKQGNIRSVCWCPSGKEFVAVYGAAPAKATLFNYKCDAVKTFGEGARNLVMVNPQGNIALIGASGNISSRFEFWNLADGQLINQLDCADITHMEWSPCGRYIITSTCSPRLRVNNGYRIFHYTCSLVHRWLAPQGSELYSARWLPNPDCNKPFVVNARPVKGIDTGLKSSSNQRYIPPSQRALAENSGVSIDYTRKFLSQKDLPPPPTQDPKVLEKKKKRQEKKELERQKKEEERGDWRKKEGEEKSKEDGKPEISADEAARRAKINRIKGLKKKLESIAQLKKERDGGKVLMKGQADKVAKEAEILRELEQLTIS